MAVVPAAAAATPRAMAPTGVSTRFSRLRTACSYPGGRAGNVRKKPAPRTENVRRFGAARSPTPARLPPLRRPSGPLQLHDAGAGLELGQVASPGGAHAADR